MDNPKAIVVMGISGSGKSSVGIALAERLGFPFFDGDDFHSKENVEKMAARIPLNDRDRAPWLGRLNQLIHEHLEEGNSLILACSALKQKYRTHLSLNNPNTFFVYLHGDQELISQRMQARKDHYMSAEMLQSQINTLEEPQDAIWIEIDKSVEEIVDQIINQLSNT